MSFPTIFTVMASIFVAYFVGKEKGMEYADEDYEEFDEDEIIDRKGRTVMMSCQTCRKLKKHREIKTNLYQCVKCKRQTDLR